MTLPTMDLDGDEPPINRHEHDLEMQGFEEAERETARQREIDRMLADARKPATRLPSSQPDRSPPHSAEAEEHVIACVMLDGSETAADGKFIYPTLTRAIDENLAPHSFYFPANRLLFEIALGLRAGDRPVELATIAEELKTRRQLEAVGGFAYLMQVTGKIPTTAHAGYFIEKVREKSVLREAIKAHTAAVEEAYGFTGGLDEFIQVSRARVEAIGHGTNSVKKADAQRLLQSHRVRTAAPPPEPVTRLFLADKPISTPGNITTLTSKAKTGKTAALGAATAAIITAAAGTSALARDTFKFRAANPEGHAVIIFDTEQSPYDAYQCYHRSLKRAGDETDPKWLHHYALVGYTVPELHQALDLALDTALVAHDGIFCVILDGVADFVASVNDEAECNGLVTWLRKRTVTYNTPIICVIHSNEGIQAGDDGRGHLGKQLIRKAESNLLLKKDGEITTITSEKQRKAPITEKDGVAFRWSDSDQMHVTTEVEAPKRGPRKQFFLPDYLSVFPTTEDTAKPFPQILPKANAKKPVSRNTFWNIVEEGTTTGEIQVNRANVNEPRYWVRG